MTPQQKIDLRNETALRLRTPYTDALMMLGRCRAGLHGLDPKDHAWSRKQLFISAKSWVREARASRYCIEAAQPDTTNARAVA